MLCGVLYAEPQPTRRCLPLCTPDNPFSDAIDSADVVNRSVLLSAWRSRWVFIRRSRTQPLVKMTETVGAEPGGPCTVWIAYCQ